MRAMRESGAVESVEESDGAGAVNDPCLEINEKLLQEIWDREKAEEKLKATASRFQALFELAPDAVFLESTQGEILDANQAACRVFGYSKQELLGMSSAELHPRDLKNELAGLKTKGGGDTGAFVEIRCLTSRGEEFPAEMSARVISLEEGRSVLVVVRDLTERKKAQREVRTLTMALEQSPASVIITDPRGDIIYVNPRFSEITGYAKQDVLGKNPRILKSGKHTKAFYKELWDTISAGKLWRGEFCNRDKSGRQFWELASISPVTDSTGKLLYYVAVKEDITDKKKREDLVRRMALYDPLTELPNRSLLMDHLSQALAQRERAGDLLALLYLDLDGFKQVNDTYGHEAGDMVLKEVGVRLRSCLRKSDTASRIGGDEFVIVLRNVQDREDVDATCMRILKAVSRPFVIADHRRSLGISIGVSLCPDHACDKNSLIRMADHAMYQVKETGKNGFRYFRPGTASRVA
jgi:diguanylate cyclase (GGDEF)-like protein/PAS domain S-box-containing protein